MQSASKRNPAVVAWTRLVRIHQYLDTQSERFFRSQDLNTAWFDVLARVGARPGMTQDELAASLLVTKGNISQLLTKMEAGGLVERRVEGRKLRLHLAPHGRTVRDRAVPEQEAQLSASLDGLTRDEQTQLISLLKKWEESCRTT